MTQSTHAKCTQKPSPSERGKALITAWRESGLSQVAYARQQSGIVHSTARCYRPQASTSEGRTHGSIISEGRTHGSIINRG